MVVIIAIGFLRGLDVLSLGDSTLRSILHIHSSYDRESLTQSMKPTKELTGILQMQALAYCISHASQP
jgi:hypothetical protein